MLLRNSHTWIATVALALVLAASQCGAAEPPKGEAPTGTKPGTPQGPWWQDVGRITGLFAALGGAITVLGAAATTIPNSIESISVRARRKQELLHIESLAELMDKLKKQEVLSADMLGKVSAQIEAEIAEALDGLQRNREKRQRLKTQDALHERLWNPAGLTSWQQYFLLYRPHGFLAWLWTLCAYALALLCTLVLLVTLIGPVSPPPPAKPVEAIGTKEGLTAFFVCLLWWWLFRWLASRAHKRWKIASLPPLTAAPGGAR